MVTIQILFENRKKKKKTLVLVKLYNSAPASIEGPAAEMFTKRRIWKRWRPCHDVKCFSVILFRSLYFPGTGGVIDVHYSDNVSKIPSLKNTIVR